MTKASKAKTSGSATPPEPGAAAASTLVAILRGPQGVVEFSNPQFSELWGRRNIGGTRMQDSLIELKEQGVLESITHAYTLNKPAISSFQHATTNELFHFLARPFHDGHGQTLGVMLFVYNELPLRTEPNPLRSEERYQAFIKNSQEGIWCVEVDQPIDLSLDPATIIKQVFQRAYLSEANDTMAAMYGYETGDQLVGTRLDVLMIPDDPANIAYLEAFIASGYRLSGVVSHEKDREGRDKYFRNSLIGIIEKGYITGAWGTQQDVTEQHQAEEALRKSEERLALALQISQMGTWEWDLTTGQLTWSDELKILFGLDPTEDITYERYLASQHPEERSRTKVLIKKALQSGKEYSFEHRIIWPDDSVHWVLGQGKAIVENGQAVRMLGTCMNIDARKQAELELVESEQRFRSMADTAPVLIWIVDTNKVCTYVNKPWLDFTGLTMNDATHGDWTAHVYPDDAPACRQQFATAFAARQPLSMKFRLLRHDGVYRWVLDNGVPRFSAEGEFLGYIGSCVDIEEVKQAEELQARNQALELQQQQLIAINQSKDEFISLASHQLRTPASGVKQYVGMLLEGFAGQLDVKQRSYLQVAYDCNERQLRIIDDLLRVAQIDSGKVLLTRKKTNLSKLLAEVIDEQASSFLRREQTVNYQQPAPILAWVDTARLRMVLENIIDNASKYSPGDTSIAVTLTEHTDHVKIQIRDQGVGIARKDIPKLFQKFSRIDNELSTLVGGTGLGLYWAKKVIDLHGGSIRVSSKPGVGSTFTLTLPR